MGLEENIGSKCVDEKPKGNSMIGFKWVRVGGPSWKVGLRGPILSKEMSVCKGVGILGGKGGFKIFGDKVLKSTGLSLLVIF